MNLIRRLKNLWKLSNLEHNYIVQEKEIIDGNGAVVIPQGINISGVYKEAQFIPRIKEDPIKRLTQEAA